MDCKHTSYTSGYKLIDYAEEYGNGVEWDFRPLMTEKNHTNLGNAKESLETTVY